MSFLHDSGTSATRCSPGEVSLGTAMRIEPSRHTGSTPGCQMEEILVKGIRAARQILVHYRDTQSQRKTQTIYATSASLPAAALNFHAVIAHVLLAAVAIAVTQLDADIHTVAALPGEPRLVRAAGLTSDNIPLLTIENRSP